MISNSTRWLLGEAETKNGDFVYFRFVAAKPTESSSLPEEISLTWRFPEAYPDAVLRASMDAFEDALGSLCFADWCRLVLVMTFRGVREWCFYTNDYQRFMAELHPILSTQPIYPIEIEHSFDPKWSYWHTFMDRRNSETKAAEPGATDNPDDAQRLREDH